MVIFEKLHLFDHLGPLPLAQMRSAGDDIFFSEFVAHTA
jgi:hypothetical protein